MAASTPVSYVALTRTVTADSLTLRSSLPVGVSQSGAIANEAISPSRSLAIADHAAAVVTDPAPHPARVEMVTDLSLSPADADHVAAVATDPAPHPALVGTATDPSPNPADADHAAVAVMDPAPHLALAEAATDLSPSPVADHAAVAATDPAPHLVTNPLII